MLTRPNFAPVPSLIPLFLNLASRAASTSDGLGTIDLMGNQMTFGPNEEIFGENEPAEYVYQGDQGGCANLQVSS